MARPILACLLMVLTLAGCSHPKPSPAPPLATSFVGTWSSDTFKDDLVTVTIRPDNTFSFVESKARGGLLVGRFDGTWSRDGERVKLHSYRSALIGGDPNQFKPQPGMEVEFTMTTAGDIGVITAGGGTGVSLRVGTISYPLVHSPEKEIARDLSPEEKQFDETVNPNKKNLPNGSPAYSQTVISSEGDQTRRAYVDAPSAGQPANQGSDKPRTIEYGSTSGDTAVNQPTDTTSATGAENPPPSGDSGTTTGDNGNGSTDSTSAGDNGSTGANNSGG
jgi:hypothetical protein